MALKAVAPEVVKPSKPKFMISGPSGVGKTMFALNFPKPFFIDAEGGATREQYMKKLVASGGVYMGKEEGAQDFKTVIDQIKELATTKHDYKTLVIDSYSKLYNTAAAIAEETVGSDYGRDKKEANKPSRQILRWIDKLDMNVALICHSRDKWERKGRDIIYTGKTFDGYDKFEYDLDLWIEIQLIGKERSYVVKKSRVDSFPVGKEFDLDYETFCTMYGKQIIDAESVPVVLATPEQVTELEQLLENVKIDEEEVQKWKAKADIETWAEMNKDQIEKCIDYLRKKINVKGAR